jgi:phosphate transport system substrate-binding protein
LDSPAVSALNLDMIFSTLRCRLCGFILCLLVPLSSPAVSDPAMQEILAALPPYERVAGVSGNLNSIGSDTLNNLLLLWAAAFREIYPNVNIQIQGAGSSTAPAALIDSTAQIGPMSRPMTGSEKDRFEARFGYAPTEVAVGIDALAVFVPRVNPIESLSLPQIDGIFSNTFRLGGSPVRTWGDVGLTGDWQDRPISLYGRNSVSGTYGFFKSVALGGGDFDGARYQERPGSSTVISSLVGDRFGIGYSGVGYATSEVRAVPISMETGEEAFAPNFENALSGDYPLARFLLVYVNRNPREPLDRLTAEFLRFILSREGQRIVATHGYFPLPPVIVEELSQQLFD